MKLWKNLLKLLRNKKLNPKEEDVQWKLRYLPILKRKNVDVEENQCLPIINEINNSRCKTIKLPVLKKQGNGEKNITYLPVLNKVSYEDKKSSPKLIIPSYFILKEMKKIGVEEELLGFATEHSKDYFLYRTEKPKMKNRSRVFGVPESKSVYEVLKNSEDFGDHFVVLIHRHPGDMLSPSPTDKKTFTLLTGLYDKVCGIILNKDHTMMNIVYNEGFSEIKIKGEGLKKGDKDGYWKIRQKR